MSCKLNEELIYVIVPIYNAEKFMDRCIQSVVNQTYTNLRILLIDDCSEDSSLNKCKDWEKKDSRIEVIALAENGRAGNARNVGLDHIDTEDGYIAFIDSDDYIPPQYLESLYVMLMEEAADFSWIGVHNTFEKTKLLFEDIDFESDYSGWTMSGKELLLQEDLRIMYCMVWGKLWRASLWKNVRFDTSYHYYEDGATTFKAIYNASKVVYKDVPLYYYFYSPESNTRSQLSETKLRDGLQTEIDKIDFYTEKKEEALLEMAYVAYLSTLLIIVQKARGIKELSKIRKEAWKLYKKNYLRGFRNRSLSKSKRIKYLLYRVCPDIQRIWIGIKQRKYK